MSLPLPWKYSSRIRPEKCVLHIEQFRAHVFNRSYDDHIESRSLIHYRQVPKVIKQTALTKRPSAQRSSSSREYDKVLLHYLETKYSVYRVAHNPIADKVKLRVHYMQQHLHQISMRVIRGKNTHNWYNPLAVELR